ncbi:dipeptidyl peptidase 4-like isoform X2 [Paramacrobiotus metropolitanus]|uniref:dipeptidyl peptidase 4-like isoform X2 n=1 Tax=Paramacrobiotus metropolitanus TaxID=2943436 RepID=UPI002445EA1B|nr:dipeptidyl peptidase 4-like isoform X2 [Paramacrobiotus metropolitanus]
MDNFEDSEELAGPESTGGKNWKGIGIALLVIAVICALVILAITLLAPSHEEHFRDGIPLAIHEVTDGSLSASYRDVQWLSGHELLFQSETNQSIILLDLQNNTKSLLVDVKTNDKINSYLVSPSRRYLLYSQDPLKVYRHTQKAFYKVFDLHYHAFPNDSREVGPEAVSLPVRLQYAKWAPSSDKLVFVYENDVYFMNYTQPNNPVQKRLTSTGSTDENEVVVYNGIPDWLYEEEILSQDNAIWWSPDSRYIAFLSFNDTLVETFSFDTYGGDSMLQQYTNSTKIRYPKAGHRNPTVQLHIVDTEKPLSEMSTNTAIPPPDKNSGFEFDDYYITSMTWLSANSLFVRWTNRHQNVSLLSQCSPEQMRCTKISIQKAEVGWLDDSEPKPVDAGRQFLMISPNFQNADPQMHRTICTYNVPMQADVRPSCLTFDYDILSILAVHNTSPLTLYVSATYDHPRNRHLLQIIGNNATCLTCRLQSNCTYFEDISFSPDSQDHFVWNCRGPNAPYSQVWRLNDLLNATETTLPLDVLKSNTALQNRLNRRALPHRKYVEYDIPAAPHGPKAQVELLLPPRLVEYADKRYPLLIKVYAGPGSQEVHSRYRMELEEFLASARDVVVARIDARGSGYQGHRLQASVYKNLGVDEVKDQLEIIKKVLEQFSYLDPSRVGIWGWSYGGYASARAVLFDNVQLLKCVASVAPVTDWRFYDTAYTERYMGLPAENKHGYDKSNLMSANFDTLYWHFGRTSFLLVHGTADDNVHFQQAAQFSKALMKSDVLFKTQVYPDEDHGIRKLRSHLYHTLVDHFLTCFGDGMSHEKSDE